MKQSPQTSNLSSSHAQAAALGDAGVGTNALVRPAERSSASTRVQRSLPTLRHFCRKKFALAALALLASNAFGQAMSKGIVSPPANVRPPYLENVGIEQRLDAQVPPDLAFTDDAGRPVRLGNYFGKKPLILNLVYYKCPMLCGEALAGLSGAMKMIKFDVGNEFDVVTVSFNPKETAADADAKKAEYVRRYGRPGAAKGWHFLTGSPESINALTEAVGFQYQYDATRNQYAHATAIMVLTPQGHISRYFYGVDFPPKDLRMGLVEASQEKIGNAVDQVLLYCYHYDPATGKYGAVVSNMLKLGGGLTIVLLGGLLLILFRLERISPRRAWDDTKSGQSGLKQTGYVR